MSRIIVSEFISVDGVIDSPGGEPEFDRSGWAFQFNRGPEGDQYKLAEVQAATALLLGRKTYAGFAAVWPTVTDEAGFAEKMNGMPKYVLSSTLTDPTWANTTVLGSVDEVAKLRESGDDTLLVNGSAQLVQALADRNLVDEYRLMVFPTILGGGRRLFGDTSAAARLKLVDFQKIGPDGVSILTYQPA
jgi:dihydrofolate reductase